ncbi:hypothetical protein SEMRO_787_G202400.1 [Seminavis robusta]|uniref:Uncharacterized protein n=1 Tax=Seminavis robusta TaxID=568900 RepID=A0A9N8E8H5_9STRA|nr:hypothetical protein SEMRO_787_G202400.1 [Seminavis robusta]|eukprot:Sro787_g202400.1 n/a (199) ;mRNA; r:39105-39701
MSRTRKHTCHKGAIPEYIFAVINPNSSIPRTSFTGNAAEESDLQRWWNDDSASTTLIDDEDLSSCSSSSCSSDKDDGEDSDRLLMRRHCHRCIDRSEIKRTSVVSTLPPTAPKRIPSCKSILSSSIDSSIASSCKIKKSLDRSAWSADDIHQARRQQDSNSQKVLGARTLCKRQSLPPRLPQRQGSNVSTMSSKTSTA